MFPQARANPQERACDIDKLPLDATVQKAIWATPVGYSWRLNLLNELMGLGHVREGGRATVAGCSPLPTVP